MEGQHGGEDQGAQGEQLVDDRQKGQVRLVGEEGRVEDPLIVVDATPRFRGGGVGGDRLGGGAGAAGQGEGADDAEERDRHRQPQAPQRVVRPDIEADQALPGDDVDDQLGDPGGRRHRQADADHMGDAAAPRGPSGALAGCIQPATLASVNGASSTHRGNQRLSAIR